MEKASSRMIRISGSISYDESISYDDNRYTTSIVRFFMQSLTIKTIRPLLVTPFLNKNPVVSTLCIIKPRLVKKKKKEKKEGVVYGIIVLQLTLLAFYIRNRREILLVSAKTRRLIKSFVKREQIDYKTTMINLLRCKQTPSII